MAMVECKECGGQLSQNADTCPHCGDVIKEPKPKFSLVDLIHKISVPVVLSVAGTMITILSYFSMEGERQMEQTRKLLADAFDKDPIKQQYCIFYVDHLLASGRISPQMTVSVLTTVAANATNDNVRLDALRTMPQLLEQKNYQQELKPLLVDSKASGDSLRARALYCSKPERDQNSVTTPACVSTSPPEGTTSKASSCSPRIWSGRN